MRKPLEGVRVVELGIYLAGPLASMILADMGAEVIKVESPSGDPVRSIGAYRSGMPHEGDKKNPWFDCANFNKNFVCLNLRTDEGKEAMLKLLSTADCMITSYRQQALEGMGLDYKTLHEKFPKLVVAHLVGYGEDGPDKNLAAWDMTAALGRAGILHNITPPGSVDAPTLPTAFFDTILGITTAAGALGGIYGAKQSGIGDYVTTGLFSTAIFAQRWNLNDWQYGQPFPPEFSALVTSDYFKSKDGRWMVMCISDPDPHYNDLVRALDREDLVDHPIYSKAAVLGAQRKHLEFRQILRDSCAKFTAQELMDRLNPVECSIQMAASYEELMKDEQVWANEFIHEVVYEDGDKYIVPCDPLRYRFGAPEYKTARARGADNEKYLKELGYTEEQIHSMIENGIAPTIPTTDYSKM